MRNESEDPRTTTQLLFAFVLITPKLFHIDIAAELVIQKDGIYDALTEN